MTFAAVGALINPGPNVSTFSLTPGAVGDLILIEVIHETTSTIFPTALSSSNVTWTTFGSSFGGTTNVQAGQVFAGKVTAAAAATVTITFSGTFTGHDVIMGREFSSTAGSWALDIQGHIDSAGTATWASLTPGGPGELYWGCALDSGSAVAGSTTGFVYHDDANSNGEAYNLNCAVSAQAPVWGDATEIFGIMVLVRETPATPAAAQHAPAWHPGAGLPGLPGGTPFWSPPSSPALPAGAVTVTTAAPLWQAQPRRPGPARARAGRAAVAAGLIGTVAISGTPPRPYLVSHPQPQRARIGAQGRNAAGAAGAYNRYQIPAPLPWGQARIPHPQPQRAIGKGISGPVNRYAVPAPLWRPQPRRPGPSRAIGKGIRGTVNPRPAVAGISRIPRLGPQRAIWRGVTGPGNATVTVVTAAPLWHPQPRRTPPSRATGHGIAGPGNQTLAFAAVPAPAWKPLPPRRGPARAMWRGVTGQYNRLPVPAPHQPPQIPRLKPQRAAWRGGANPFSPVPAGYQHPPRNRPAVPPSRAISHGITGPANQSITYVAVPAPRLLRQPPRRFPWLRAIWRAVHGTTAPPSTAPGLSFPVVTGPVHGGLVAGVTAGNAVSGSGHGNTTGGSVHGNLVSGSVHGGTVAGNVHGNAVTGPAAAPAVTGRAHGNAVTGGPHGAAVTGSQHGSAVTDPEQAQPTVTDSPGDPPAG